MGISGRGQASTRSDNLVPSPFRHPPVRCRLGPKARSWAHIRAGHPVCGQALGMTDECRSSQDCC
jgi:hypothetical protein